jgi:hypothetical protein
MTIIATRSITLMNPASQPALAGPVVSGVRRRPLDSEDDLPSCACHRARANWPKSVTKSCIRPATALPARRSQTAVVRPMKPPFDTP